MLVFIKFWTDRLCQALRPHMRADNFDSKICTKHSVNIYVHMHAGGIKKCWKVAGQSPKHHLFSFSILSGHFGPGSQAKHRCTYALPAPKSQCKRSYQNDQVAMENVGVL